jgi:hypothetical protein
VRSALGSVSSSLFSWSTSLEGSLVKRYDSTNYNSLYYSIAHSDRCLFKNSFPRSNNRRQAIVSLRLWQPQSVPSLESIGLGTAVPDPCQLRTGKPVCLLAQDALIL